VTTDTLATREEAFERFRANLRNEERPVGALGVSRALRAVGTRFRPRHRPTWVAFRRAAEQEVEPYLNASAKDVVWAVLEGDFGRLMGGLPNTRAHSLADTLADPGDDGQLPAPIPATLVEDVVPPGFLIEDVVPAAEFGMNYADGGVFKTTISLALAGAVAGGYAILGRDVQRGPVLYVSEEDSAGILQNRLVAIATGHSWDLERVMADVHFLACEGATLDSERWRDHIAEWTEKLGAVLVVFDPYAELTLAAENSNDDAKPNVRFFRRLTRLGATVLVNHHAGKAVEGKRQIDRLRGASAMYSACRFAFMLKQRSGTRIALECVKMSRAPKPPELAINIAVDTDLHNPTVWTAATVRAVDKRTADRVDAELAILEPLDESPGLNSTELRDAAVARGVSPVEVASTMRRFEERHIIESEPGRGNAKHWRLTETGRARLLSLHSTRMQMMQAEPALPASEPDAGFGTPSAEPASPSLEDAGEGRVYSDLYADLEIALDEGVA